MLVLLHVALALQSSVAIGVGSASSDSARKARESARRARNEAWSEDGSSRREKKPGRRIPLTDELRASAFHDPAAKSLLLRARVARLNQDSLLQSYDANTYQRLSVGLGFKAFGRDRLAIRGEDAAHVRWMRGRGAFVELTGRRAVSPILGKNDGEADVDMGAPIPYYPGREDLWIAGGLAQAQVDESSFVHPIAEGAEAYYTYQSGDSLIITLPDGKRITLRELKITARWPKWNLSVGSFWFDEESAHLVRAAYRLSMPLDVWAVEREEREASKSDTTARRRGDGPPAAAKALLSPMKVDVSAITVDYGLYNQRFWMPRAQALEGMAQISFMRVPMTMEQRFKYQSVNGVDSFPAMPARPLALLRALRDSLDSAKTPKPERDSLVRAFSLKRQKELETLHEKECAESGSYTRVQRRYENTVTVATRIPCDSTKLANSPDLPASIYDPGEELFSSADREQLRQALTFGLQPSWGPQMPQAEWGLSQTRYNRVEGFSTGVVLTSVLGRGYSAALAARGSLADRQLGGELTLSRSNGRSRIRGTVYRRLDVMTDWGTPLSFGASLASLLYARDEGAYYRTWGAELAGQHPQWGSLDWRLFAEQQWNADVRSPRTLFGKDSRFIANPHAQSATEYGASLRLHATKGLDPDGFRLLSDVRAEGAGGDFSYGRALFDETLSHAMPAQLAASLTVSAGYSAGTVPVQRLFYLGGSQSVRGQTALTASGDAFWLAHAELGHGSPAARLAAFADVGWAGDRRSWSTPGRPLSGAGLGYSLLDGLIRFDVARGLYPAKQWRADLYFEARF